MGGGGTRASQLVWPSRGRGLVPPPLGQANLTWDTEKVACREQSPPTRFPFRQAVSEPSTPGLRGAREVSAPARSLSDPGPPWPGSLPESHDRGLGEFPPDPRTGRRRPRPGLLASPHRLQAELCVSCPVCMLNPNPRCDGSRRKGLGEAIGSSGWDSFFLITGAPESSHLLQHRRTRKGGPRQTRKRALTKHRTFSLGFPASRNSINKSLLFISHRVGRILAQQPEQTRTPPS